MNVNHSDVPLNIRVFTCPPLFFAAHESFITTVNWQTNDCRCAWNQHKNTPSSAVTSCLAESRTQTVCRSIFTCIHLLAVHTHSTENCLPSPHMINATSGARAALSVSVLCSIRAVCGWRCEWWWRLTAVENVRQHQLGASGTFYTEIYIYEKQHPSFF